MKTVKKIVVYDIVKYIVVYMSKITENILVFFIIAYCLLCYVGFRHLEPFKQDTNK